MVGNPDGEQGALQDQFNDAGISTVRHSSILENIGDHFFQNDVDIHLIFLGDTVIARELLGEAEKLGPLIHVVVHAEDFPLGRHRLEETKLHH